MHLLPSCLYFVFAACKSVICLPLMVGNVWAMLHPTMMIYIFDLQTEGAGFNNFFSFWMCLNYCNEFERIFFITPDWGIIFTSSSHWRMSNVYHQLHCRWWIRETWDTWKQLHPVGGALSSDWSGNFLIMVVYGRKQTRMLFLQGELQIFKNRTKEMQILNNLSFTHNTAKSKYSRR